MTRKNIEDLLKIRESENYTESDVECYCDAHGIDYDAAVEVLRIEEVLPECCVGCKHSAFCSNLSPIYPCNQCARIIKDVYEIE